MSPVKVTILKLYRDAEMCMYLFNFPVCCVFFVFIVYMLYMFYMFMHVFLMYLLLYF